MERTERKPIATDKIPAELKRRPQWVVWRREKKNEKWTKVPYNARTGRRASSTDSTTWSTFEQANAELVRNKEYDGIGFGLTKDGGIVGIDIDGCIHDDAGAIDPAVIDIIKSFGSYAEVSPSGAGVRIFGYAKLPPGRRKKGRYEAYDSGRYLTVTGQHFDGAPLTVNESQRAVDDFCARFLHEEPRRRSSGDNRRAHGGIPIDDAELLTKAKRARNGAAFSRLYFGDWEGDYGSQSEADLALCSWLAFWTDRDADRMDRLFRSSRLMRDKWDERHGPTTYGQMTIETAIEGCTQTYGCRAAGAFQVDTNGVRSAGHDAAPLPTIVVSDQPLQNMTERSIAALVNRNTPPRLFVRAAALTRIQIDERGRPSTERMSESEVRGAMARAAYYIRETRDGPIRESPPMDAVKDVMACGKWPFPPLGGIVEVPCLRPDGTVLEQPGYDAATTLYYIPESTLVVAGIPLRPTLVDVESALAIIDEMLWDFPFADKASRANLLATMLTPIVRPMINGPTPLALFDAPKQGTGKTLLLECVARIATGRTACPTVAPRDDDEWRKKITSLLLRSPTIIAIDNVDGQLDSPSLACALTTTEWQDRILGESRTASLPQRATWIATGNNIRLAGDLPRRCYLVRLDARTARPEERSGFRHPNLVEWVSENRGYLMGALLTLARAYFGDPKRTDYTGPVVGSYESWCRIVGGVLQHAGVEDFLGNIDEMRSHNDAEACQWEAFFEAWHDQYGDLPVLANRVARDLERDGEFRDALPDFLAEDVMRNTQKFKKTLGEKLARKKDAQHGVWRLEAAGKDRKKSRLWRVVDTTNGGGTATDASD